MHPDRYGQPGTTGDKGTSGSRWFESEDPNYYGPGLVRSPGNELWDAVTGLIILSLAATLGFAITVTAYRLTHPENLTATWIFGYIGVFAASSFVTALLLYAVRRIVLTLILSAIVFSAGYVIWHLLIA